MVDRTLVICAGLVIIAALLFAGTGFLLMHNGAPGQNHAGRFDQMNDEKRISTPQGIQSENNAPPVFHQGKSPVKPGESRGQGEPGRCDCPCSMKNNEKPGDVNQENMDSRKPGNQENGGMIQGQDYSNRGTGQDQSTPHIQGIPGGDQKEKAGGDNGSSGFDRNRTMKSSSQNGLKPKVSTTG